MHTRTECKKHGVIRRIGIGYASSYCPQCGEEARVIWPFWPLKIYFSTGGIVASVLLFAFLFTFSSIVGSIGGCNERSRLRNQARADHVDEVVASMDEVWQTVYVSFSTLHRNYHDDYLDSLTKRKNIKFPPLTADQYGLILDAIYFASYKKEFVVFVHSLPQNKGLTFASDDVE